MHMSHCSWTILKFTLLNLMVLSSAFSLTVKSLRIGKPRCYYKNIKTVHHSTSVDIGSNSVDDTSDLLITGLNYDQDFTVKVITCRELVQEVIIKNELSAPSAKTLGEVMASCLLMASGIKDEETYQLNFVGKGGIGNIMAITDSKLKTRGMVGNTKFYTNKEGPLLTSDMFNELGQIQVVRSHPSYKQPMNGIIEMRDNTIATNLALYLAESEQRAAALLLDVNVDGNLCRHCLGILVERLPGASDINIEQSIKNLEAISKKTLASYLKFTEEEQQSNSNQMFRDFEGPLNRILDDSLTGMGDGIRWSKLPKYRCNCGVERVWRALRLLPLDDVKHVLDEQGEIEMKCEFCGEVYRLGKEEVTKEIIEPRSQ